jgi:hypothetical protein
MSTATLSQQPATKPASAAPVDVESLTRVPLAALTQPSSTSVDVFMSTSDAPPKLLWQRDAKRDDAQLADLRRQRGQYAFWIQRNDFGRVTTAVQEHWFELAALPSLPPCDGLALLSLAFSLELNATVRLVRCQPFVAAARRVGDAAVTLFTRGPIDSRDLFEMAASVNGFGFRALNVAVYTLQIARLSGADPAVFSEIAVGAMVHDVGARNLFVDAWANPGRWSAEERELVERHPRQGFEDLLPLKFSRGQLMMAYQHHERIDGTGYPVGIIAEEIHPWAKMLAIADRFEALTSGRSYRRGMSLPEALVQLEQDAGNHLDREMTQCWMHSLQSS